MARDEGVAEEETEANMSEKGHSHYHSARDSIPNLCSLENQM